MRCECMASAVPSGRGTEARLIIFRLIVYQRWLIPLAFPVRKIKDIKTIKAQGGDCIWVGTSLIAVALCNIRQLIANCNRSAGRKCELVEYPHQTTTRCGCNERNSLRPRSRSLP